MRSDGSEGTFSAVVTAAGERGFCVMSDMTPDRSRKKSVRHTLGAVASIVRSQPRRIRFGEVDVEDLRHLKALGEVVEAAVGDMARGLVADGYSWGEVGRALGVTRQEAHRRYRK